MDSDNKIASASLMDIPFKTLCDALRDLRASKSIGSRRGKGAGPVSVAKQYRRELAGFDSAADAASLESKRDVLTRFWKEVAGQLRNVDAQRRGADPKSGVDGMAVKMEDFSEEEEEEFRPSTVLPVDVTEKLLKLICPALDDSHSLYSMKEKKIAEHYVDALSLPKFASDAQWLLNYADPEMRRKAEEAARNNKKKFAIRNAVEGVFVSVLRAVLSVRASNSSDKTLTVGKVWELLTTLHESKEATGSKYLAQGHARYGADAAGDAAGALITENRPIQAASEDREAQKRRRIAEKKDARMGVFQVMINHATAAENAEFARLILKDTEVRLREDHLLKWFHPDAKQYYDCTHNLKRLIVDLRDPSFSVKSVGIQPGTACAVMNTARPTKSNLKKIAGILATGAEGEGVGANERKPAPYFLMEPKFDGERMQLHKMGSHVLTYTRNRKDSTAIYGALLAPAVLSAVRAHNCILDGEIMLWDETGQKWVPFEDMRSILQQMRDRNVPQGERYSLKFCVFDLLYVEQKPSVSVGAATIGARVDDKCDASTAVVMGSSPPGERSERSEIASLSQPHGENTLSAYKRKRSKVRANNSLIEYHLSKRKELLVGNVDNYETKFADGFRSCVILVEGVHGSTEADLVRGMEDFVRQGYEGLVAKSPVASYGMGERRPDMAVKLKPDYFEGGLQDIDVVILAGKYGTGSGQKRGRVGTLSSFLVGVRTHDTVEAVQRYVRGEGSWTPVGSVGTGYSFEQLGELQRQLEPYWREFEDKTDRRKFPSFWDTQNQSDTMFTDCAKWIEPRDSVVLTVRAYELARRQGVALRFPRCDRIRHSSEKPVHEAISLEELKQVDDAKSPATVGSSGGQDDEEVTEEAPGSKKRKRTIDAQEIAENKATHTTVARAKGMRLKRDPTAVQAFVSDIKKEDRLGVLSGRCFRVLAPKDQGTEKHDMERSLYRLGADLTQEDFSADITDVLALDAEHWYVKKACSDSRSGERKDLGYHSILRPEWLAECERTRSGVAPKRKHLFFANKQLDAELLRHTDHYGDPWAPTTTSKSFLASLAEMDEMQSREELPSPPAADDPDIEEVVKQGMRDAGLCFWGILAYFPSTVESSRRHASTSTQSLIRFFGGEVITELKEGSTPTHVVFPDHCPVEEQALLSEKLRGAGAVNAAFVSRTWVQKCADAQRFLPPFLDLVAPQSLDH